MKNKLMTLCFMLATLLSFSAYADEMYVFINNSPGKVEKQDDPRSLQLSYELLKNYGYPDKVYSNTTENTSANNALNMLIFLAQEEKEGVFKKENMPKVPDEIEANTEYVTCDKVALLGDLLDQGNKDKTIFIAWDDKETPELIKEIIMTFDQTQANQFQPTPNSIYVVRLFDVGNKKIVTVETLMERTNNDK